MVKSEMSENESEENASLDHANGSTHSQSIVKPVSNSPIQTSTPISLIIQSLVQNLCYYYQRDPAEAEKVYNRMCKVLFKMTIIDRSYTMSEFEGLRSQFQRSFRHWLTTISHPETFAALKPLWPNQGNDTSRYATEFHELSFIAGGGFGKVYRVRNKLDGIDYAMKKVAIRSKRINSVLKHLDEVRTFASLNHSNIVQYKSAWWEMGHFAGPGQVEDEDSSDEFDYELTEEECDEFARKLPSNDSQNHLSQSEHSKEMHTFALAKDTKYRTITHSLQLNVYPKWATLFIQMSLCHSTLKQWLEERNANEMNSRMDQQRCDDSQRISTIMDILRQLFCGLEYIHSKRIVHHDIKPSNIFLQFAGDALLVQLGDFGLACTGQLHPMVCGTNLYVAPEQLEGICDSKNDMFSAGIVAFELSQSFCTDMERYKYITEIRKGCIPDNIHVHHPQLANIISKLIVPQSSERPDASSLVKSISVTDGRRVRELENIVDAQESQLAAKDEEILQLKEQLSRLQILNELSSSH